MKHSNSHSHSNLHSYSIGLSSNDVPLNVSQGKKYMKYTFTIILLLFFGNFSFSQINITYEEEGVISEIKKKLRDGKYKEAFQSIIQNKGNLPDSFCENFEYAYFINKVVDTITLSPPKQGYLQGTNFNRKEYETITLPYPTKGEVQDTSIRMHRGESKTYYTHRKLVKGYRYTKHDYFHGPSFEKISNEYMLPLKQDMIVTNWYDGNIDTVWNDQFRQLFIFYVLIENKCLEYLVSSIDRDDQSVKLLRRLYLTNSPSSGVWGGPFAPNAIYYSREQRLKLEDLDPKYVEKLAIKIGLEDNYKPILRKKTITKLLRKIKRSKIKRHSSDVKVIKRWVLVLSFNKYYTKHALRRRKTDYLSLYETENGLFLNRDGLSYACPRSLLRKLEKYSEIRK